MDLYNGDEYRATKDWPYAIAAGCVVYRLKDGMAEVLLLKREKGHPNSFDKSVETYNLPKGHVSQSESLTDTAQRETEEETGFLVTIKTYLGATTHEFVHPLHKMLNIKTTHYFAAQYIKSSSGMDSEHDGLVWLSLAGAKEKLADPATRRDEAKFIDRLEQYLAIIGS